LSSASDGRSAYLDLVDRVRRFARAWIPAGGRVAVVSKGDDALLALDGVEAVHFPGTPEGGYAGYYPADGADALAQVEQLRARGIRHLLFPATAFWWLDHYAGLREHLERDCERVSRDDETAVLFALMPALAETGPAPTADAVAAATAQLAEVLDALLPPGVGALVVDAEAARGGLRALRAGGARFVAVPHDPALAPPGAGALLTALRESCGLVTDQRHVCTLFDLRRPARTDPEPPARGPSAEDAVDPAAARVARGLLPAGARVLFVHDPRELASALAMGAPADFAVLPPAAADAGPPPPADLDLIWSDRRCRIYALPAVAGHPPTAGAAGPTIAGAPR
jgi:hypothetical protein